MPLGIKELNTGPLFFLLISDEKDGKTLAMCSENVSDFSLSVPANDPSLFLLDGM